MINLVLKDVFRRGGELEGSLSGEAGDNWLSSLLWLPSGVSLSVCGSQSSRFHKWAVLKTSKGGVGKL